MSRLDDIRADLAPLRERFQHFGFADLYRTIVRTEAERDAAEARAVRAEQAIQRVEKELAEWDRIGYPTDPDPQAAVRAALAGEDSTDEK